MTQGGNDGASGFRARRQATDHAEERPSSEVHDVPGGGVRRPEATLPSAVLGLQRLAGNAAVCGLLKGATSSLPVQRWRSSPWGQDAQLYLRQLIPVASSGVLAQLQAALRAAVAREPDEHGLVQFRFSMLREIAREDAELFLLELQQRAGRDVRTPYGHYWVGPLPPPESELERLDASEFAELTRTWEAIVRGGGRLHVEATDDSGPVGWGSPGAEAPNPAFRARMVQQLGLLLSRPLGRRLVRDLVLGPHDVFIRPSRDPTRTAGRIAGSAVADEEQARRGPRGPGRGSGTTVYVDPDLRDDTIVALNQAGQPISNPLYLILGHELIHARNNALGVSRTHEAPMSPGNRNAEEEATIFGATNEPDEPSENRIRWEHDADESHHAAGMSANANPWARRGWSGLTRRQPGQSVLTPPQR